MMSNVSLAADKRVGMPDVLNAQPVQGHRQAATSTKTTQTPAMYMREMDTAKKIQTER